MLTRPSVLPAIVQGDAGLSYTLLDVPALGRVELFGSGRTTGRSHPSFVAGTFRVRHPPVAPPAVYYPFPTSLFFRCCVVRVSLEASSVSVAFTFATCVCFIEYILDKGAEEFLHERLQSFALCLVVCSG